MASAVPVSAEKSTDLGLTSKEDATRKRKVGKDDIVRIQNDNIGELEGFCAFSLLFVK